MAGATRLQVRSRGIAAITAVLFVACGLLAMRHEAGTAHVRDRAGAYVHASTLAGHHAGHDADIHGQHTPDVDIGDCALLAVLHQAASADVATPAIAAHAPTLRAHGAPHRARLTAVTDVYRFAPKTSPPVAA